MQVFDASSMIYAWDNYPIRQFPGLWRWIGEQIEEKELVVPRVAFEEVANVTPDCADWLKKNNLQLLDINNTILHEAMRIKELLGIKDDNYHSKGVGENDILIIATAHVNHAELVSDEARQTSLPKTPSNRKIPAVCKMDEIDVRCVSFIEYIKQSNEIFN
jgi:hypothetical protein